MSGTDGRETKTVGVLGASGETGRIVAQLLAEHSTARLVLFGRRFDALERVRDGLPDPGRTEVRAVDAADAAAFTTALAGVDVVVVTAPLLDRLHGVLSSTLAAGVDWIDVLLDGPQKWDVLEALAPVVVSEGRRVITGCGLHPGLVAVLIRAVAPRFDVMTKAEVAQLVAADWSSYRVNVDTMAEFTRELTSFDTSSLVQGKWRRVPVWTTRRFGFGSPFGHRSCAPMGLPELRELTDQYPGLNDCALYMAGFNPVTDWLVMPVAIGMAMLSKRLAGHGARWLLWSLKRFSRPPFGSVSQVLAEGTGHEPVRLRVAHEEGGYWLTAAVAAATTLQYLDGAIAAPGVHIEGLVADPARLLTDLQAWGARVSQWLE